MIMIDCGDCDGTGRTPGGEACPACGGAQCFADPGAAGLTWGPRTGDREDYAVDRTRDEAVGL
ncbi:hypothetical protein [Nocardia wallacei]|uniref:hypothetical protein n=1 Tax=Nocardia wallacei TaxID=480035 RepID=UPI0024538F04|nr:hypothetical protein [Nocardia wallacei]